MSAGGAHLKNEGSQWQVTSAGAVAGLVSRFCIAPLDVVKIRLQLQTSKAENGTFRTSRTLQTARDIFRNEGIRGFWRGNIPAEALYVTYGAAQFTAYRMTAKFFDSLSLPPSLSSFLSGGVAGGMATAVTYPLDLLRTRFAAQGTSQVYTSIVGSIGSIYREEGIGGFFRGLPVTVGQIVPYMGLFFTTYENFRPLTAQLSLPFGSNDALAGIMASTVSKTGVFPLDLVRRRIQVQGPRRSGFGEGKVPEYGRGAWQVAKTVVAQEGWRGLYKGLGISLLKAAPASAVTMWTYEHALGMFRRMN